MPTYSDATLKRLKDRVRRIQSEKSKFQQLAHEHEQKSIEENRDESDRRLREKRALVNKFEQERDQMERRHESEVAADNRTYENKKKGFQAKIDQAEKLLAVAERQVQMEQEKFEQMRMQELQSKTANDNRSSGSSRWAA